MKICVVNFSGRRDGNCHDIARFIEQSLAAEHEITLFEMCDLEVAPCGKCDYECFYEDKTCPYAYDDMAGIYNTICMSDLSCYILPNYIDYPNAYFFIFNERKQGFFGRRTHLSERYSRIAKKFVVVSNTEEDNFRQILGRHVAENGCGEFLFLAAKDFDKGGVRGGMMESEQAKAQLYKFIRGFC
jgi:multimeric flavodoxin WrbA